MQQEEQHTSKKRIYFTVVVSDSGTGVADQLGQFMALRKFGLYLSYSYLHTPLDSYRRISTAPLNLPRILRKFHTMSVRYYQNNIQKYIYPDVYDFIGLNSYFSSISQNIDSQPHINKWNVLDLTLYDLSDSEKGNISNLEELQNYINGLIFERNNSQNPILIRLHKGKSRGQLWQAVYAAIPNSIDRLSLPDIYFEYKSKHPWKSRFPLGTIKTLVHLRMGDFAPIKTSLGTWIYFDRDRTKMWRECLHEDEFEQLTIADFYNFTQRLISYFDDGTFAIHFSSDGFKRAFSTLYNMSNYNPILGMTKKQLSTILKRYKYYEPEFEILKGIKNSVSVIGETKPNLLDLIHSTFTADLVITAFPVQHKLPLFFLSYYREFKSIPTVILLHKPNAREKAANYSGNPLYKGKIIPVDITEPNFDRIAQRLNELFPNLSN